MRINPPQFGQVESLGRNDTRSVRSIATALSAKADATTSIATKAAGVVAGHAARDDKEAALEKAAFDREEKRMERVLTAEKKASKLREQSKLEREEAAMEKQLIAETKKLKLKEQNLQRDTATTDTMIGSIEIDRALAGKTVFTADEIEGYPEIAHLRTNPDGSRRNDIPAYLVVPVIANQQKQSLMQEQAAFIDDSFMREAFLNKASLIAAKQDLGYTLKAIGDQKTYDRDTRDSTSLRLAAEGFPSKAKDLVIDGPFNPLEIRERLIKIDKIYEWEKDTRLLNTLDLDEIQKRYDYMTQNYGDSVGDDLGQGSPTGQYNLEANKKRFSRYIDTGKKAASNADYKLIEKSIAAAKDGNIDGNDLYAGGNPEAVIWSSKTLTDNQKRTLSGLAINAMWEGNGRNEAKLMPFAVVQQNLEEGVKQLTEMPVEKHSRAKAYLQGLKEGSANIKERLLADATTYLGRESPAVKAALENLSKPEIAKNPVLRKQAMSTFLATSRAEQERMGMTTEQINFLTEAQVAGFAEESANVGKTPMGVSRLITLLDSLEENYKDEYATVYTNLIRKKILKPEQVVSSLIYDKSARVRYINALEGIEESSKKQDYKITHAKALAQTIDAMGPVLNTIDQSEWALDPLTGLSSNAQLSSLQNGFAQILVNEAQNGTVNHTASEDLVSKAFNDRWLIYEKLRVPKDRNFAPNVVVRGLGYLRGSKVDIPDDIILVVNNVNGLTSADSQMLYREEIKGHLQPRTRNDEGGIVFVTRSGEVVNMLDNGQVRPLTIDYEFMASFALEFERNGDARVTAK